ncbi:MAG: PQQ-dependent sugar dehydrogenase [Trueperaceae bacterium]|nr:PQQ-dependent sugar dehydrogenase [Trueperaceae bacterium]
MSLVSFLRQMTLIVFLVLINIACNGSAQNDPVFNLLASGFNRPIGITHAGDGSSRLFITEQGGKILIIKDSKVLEDPFLDISDRVSRSGGERGLLGLAFHPDYKNNGRFFVNYTDTSGNTVIAEYSVSNNADLAAKDSENVLLTFNQPFANHNGGHLAFGPKDGFLYIATGDGGDGGDPQGNGQALYTPLGKLLRIDVDSGDPYAVPETNPWANSPDAFKEIWAYGLRNPWRFSFDRETGDLYIADVGQNKYEEVNFQAASSKGGENYGWNTMEGMHCYNPRNNCDETGLTLPVVEYGHDEGVSVTGGFVYRGISQIELLGKYLYADFANGKIWILERKNGEWLNSLYKDTDFQISSFGEDEQGELYIAHFGGGEIYRIGK